jgi:hypothetical protein
MKENKYHYQSSEQMDYNQHEKVNIKLFGNKADAGNPIIFPPICVNCGSDQTGGQIFRDKLKYFLTTGEEYVPLWVNVKYYLCPGCWEAHKTKKAIKWVMWVSFFLLVIFAIGNESGALGILSVLAFIGGVVAAVHVRIPLKLIDFDESQFFVKVNKGFVNASKNFKEKEGDARQK